MIRKMELLAPAGGTEALRAAVENGADAVYLGGKLFNARRLADNFSGEELENALRYAHVRGVRIYLTMNTLVSDAEMGEALKFAAAAWLSGVDAVIVQDIGFAAALRRVVPGIQLHASTQMTIYNPEGVRMLEGMGFKRVVLARELSLEEIKKIKEASAIETEVFVHGALCVSYSGQCLMSSVIGGRSGNRGNCAQPCRLPYSLVRQGGKEIRPSYLMSPKDLCLLPELGRLAAAGVRSLKIEGRMKSPEYVATVVRIYRKYLDSLYEKPEKGFDTAINVEERDMRDLLQIFNRGGFTKGYSGGKTGRDMMCFEKPKNWGIYLGRVLAADSGRGTVRLRLEDSLSVGDGIEAWNGEEKSPGTIVTLLLRDGSNVRTAAKGETVTVGSIRGNIPAGCGIYKTSDRELNTAAAETYAGKPLRRIRLKGRAVLRAGGPLVLTVRDGDGNEAAAAGGMLPEPAVSRPVTAGRLSAQLEKTGATPFELTDVEMELDENLSLPVSEINEVRRKALEALERTRASARARPAGKDRIDAAIRRELERTAPSRPVPRAVPGISAYFYKMPAGTGPTGVRGERSHAELFLRIGAKRLYLPFESCLKPGFDEISAACREAGSELFLWLPPVTRGNYDRLVKARLNGKGLSGVDGVLAGNPGTIEMLRGAKGLRLAGDLSMNIFNRLSLEEAAGMGLESVTLSAELTLGQSAAIAAGSPVAVEAAVYGRLPLMTSEYCPVGCTEGGFGSGRECGGSCRAGDFRLRDRMGMEFPVLCDRIDCRSTILNSNVLFLPDSLKKLRDSGIGLFRLYISDETPDIVGKLAELHRKALTGEASGDFEDFIGKIKARGFTKGHYYRGV
jgi:putative protease